MTTAKRIIEATVAAGLKLTLAPAGGLAVTPASKLTPVLRDLIRTGKNDLVRWFTAANDNNAEPPADPTQWKELSEAYHQHHNNCTFCQAAGRGARYGLRCGTGSALWLAYQETSL
jgi:hypothetical protein